jgi:7-cyano-7-deazaguanine synthase in queuosine biosynthesis
MKHYYALFSGGLDSTLAILLVSSQRNTVRITPIFFKYGQKSAVEEEKAVRRLFPLLRKHLGNPSSVLDECREFDIAGLFSWSNSPILQHNSTSEGSPDVENRNMILIGCAASLMMADQKRRGNEAMELMVGFKNEHYDTKRQFASAINGVFKTMGKPISLITPLISERQTGCSAPKRLAKYAHALGVFDLLKESWSCYYPQSGKPCNNCSACEGRSEFFSELRVRIREKGKANLGNNLG